MRKGIRLALAAVLTGALVFSVGASRAADDLEIEKARAFIRGYSDAPTAFPVTEPLKKLPTGKKIAIIDCGSPICGLFANLAQQPSEMLGMTLTRIKAGTTADGVAAAFDTVLEGHFDGVFVPAVAPSLWQRYLNKLDAAHIPVVASGIIGLDRAKVPVVGASETSTTLGGVLMADWAVARDGSKLDAVFYTTPELSFTNLLADVFVKEAKERCKNCVVRVVEIPVATFGNKAPTIVVDDLLAHPKTTVAVFAVGEQTIGLPSALKIADIKLPMLLNVPGPSELSSIRDGTYTAGLGNDLAVLTWTMVDSLARLTTGQVPAEGALRDQLVCQFLSANNIKGDTSRGWTGYPDFPDRFKALWAAAK